MKPFLIFALLLLAVASGQMNDPSSHPSLNLRSASLLPNLSTSETVIDLLFDHPVSVIDEIPGLSFRTKHTASGREGAITHYYDADGDGDLDLFMVGLKKNVWLLTNDSIADPINGKTFSFRTAPQVAVPLPNLTYTVAGRVRSLAVGQNVEALQLVDLTDDQVDDLLVQISSRLILFPSVTGVTDWAERFQTGFELKEARYGAAPTGELVVTNIDPVMISRFVSNVAVLDLNGDGLKDIVYVDNPLSSSGEIVTILNSGSSLAQGAAFGVPFFLKASGNLLTSEEGANPPRYTKVRNPVGGGQRRGQLHAVNFPGDTDGMPRLYRTNEDGKLYVSEVQVFDGIRSERTVWIPNLRGGSRRTQVASFSPFRQIELEHEYSPGPIFGVSDVSFTPFAYSADRLGVIAVGFEKNRGEVTRNYSPSPEDEVNNFVLERSKLIAFRSQTSGAAEDAGVPQRKAKIRGVFSYLNDDPFPDLLSGGSGGGEITFRLGSDTGNDPDFTFSELRTANVANVNGDLNLRAITNVESPLERVQASQDGESKEVFQDLGFFASRYELDAGLIWEGQGEYGVGFALRYLSLNREGNGFSLEAHALTFPGGFRSILNGMERFSIRSLDHVVRRQGNLTYPTLLVGVEERRGRQTVHHVYAFDVAWKKGDSSNYQWGTEITEDQLSELRPQLGAYVELTSLTFSAVSAETLLDSNDTVVFSRDSSGRIQVRYLEGGAVASPDFSLTNSGELFFFKSRPDGSLTGGRKELLETSLPRVTRYKDVNGERSLFLATQGHLENEEKEGDRVYEIKRRGFDDLFVTSRQEIQLSANYQFASSVEALDSRNKRFRIKFPVALNLGDTIDVALVRVAENDQQTSVAEFTERVALMDIELTGLDSDGDGLSDELETRIGGYNPLVAEDHSELDYDGDSLSNLEELSLGTSLVDRDTDRDTIPDNEDESPLEGTPLLRPDFASLPSYFFDDSPDDGFVREVDVFVDFEEPRRFNANLGRAVAWGYENFAKQEYIQGPLRGLNNPLQAGFSFEANPGLGGTPSAKDGLALGEGLTTNALKLGPKVEEVPGQGGGMPDGEAEENVANDVNWFGFLPNNVTPSGPVTVQNQFHGQTPIPTLLSFWFKTEVELLEYPEDHIGSNTALFSYFSNASRQQDNFASLREIGLYLSSRDFIRLEGRISGRPNTIYYRVTNPLNDGKWHHVAIWMNTRSSRRGVYVDGKKLESEFRRFVGREQFRNDFIAGFRGQQNKIVHALYLGRPDRGVQETAPEGEMQMPGQVTDAFEGLIDRFTIIRNNPGGQSFSRVITDLYNADTDNDRIPDRIEADSGRLVDEEIVRLMDPVRPEDPLADHDEDGIPTLLELYPLDDRNQDGQPDLWAFFPEADFDGDGVPNKDDMEVADGFNPEPTDPLVPNDTDGDGLTDLWEIDNGLNYLVADANGDVDGDRLTNLDEFLLGTNPRRTDSDGDGIVDNLDRSPVARQPRTPRGPSAPVGGGGSPPAADPFEQVERAYRVDIRERSEDGEDVRHVVLSPDLRVLSGSAFVNNDDGVTNEITVRALNQNYTGRKVGFLVQREDEAPPWFEASTIEIGAEASAAVTFTGSITAEEKDTDDPTMLALAFVGAHMAYDADNNSNFSLPDQNLGEVAAQVSLAGGETPSPEQPGKLLYAQKGDMDGDGIPNYVDGLLDAAAVDRGIGRRGPPGNNPFSESNTPQCRELTPIILSLARVDPALGEYQVQVTYDASNPASVRRVFSSSKGRHFYRLPEDGELRLWTKNRQLENVSALPFPSGHFLQNGKTLRKTDLEQLTYDEQRGGYILWVESIKASREIADQEIEFEVSFLPSGESRLIEVETLVSYYSSIDLSLSKLTSDSSIEASEGEIELSHPSPAITGGITVSKPRWGTIEDNNINDTGARGWIVDAQLSLEIRSEVLDTLHPRQRGSHLTVNVHVNGSELPQRTLRVPIVSSGGGSFSKPFPCRASVQAPQGMLRGLAATDGVNVVEIRVAEKTYNLEGYASYSYQAEFPSVEVDEDGEPTDDSYTREYTTEQYNENRQVVTYRIKIADGEDATDPDEIKLSISNAANVSDLVLAKEVRGEEVSYVSQDGLVAVAAIFDTIPAETNDLLSAVIAPIRGFQGGSQLLLESSAPSPPGVQKVLRGSFSISTLFTESITITETILFDRSDGGDFAPYVWDLAGPPALINSLGSMTFSDAAPGAVRARTPAGTLSSSFQVDLVEASRLAKEESDRRIEESARMILANSFALNKAGIVSFRQAGGDTGSSRTTEQFMAAVSKIRDLEMGPTEPDQFALGFASGFAKGGMEMVGGLGATVVAVGEIAYKTGAKVVRGISWGIRVHFKLLTGRSIALEKRQAAKALANARAGAQRRREKLKLLVQLGQEAPTAITAVLTGRYGRLSRLSQPMQSLMLRSIELIANVLEQVSTDSYQRGYYSGRAIFEVATVAFPWGKLAQAGKVLSKVEMLDQLAAKSKFFKPGGLGSSAMTKTQQTVVAGLRTTRMCFVAGTLVAVPSASGAVGYQEIQDVRVGDLVWSRPELSGGDTVPKRVRQTFVTHPTVLHTVALDHDGDGYPDEEIQGTGEHPFWEVRGQKWTEMRDLEKGSILVLLDQRQSTVLSNNKQNAPPGESFTTYNFEVEDFHTYFVGQSGVWVHNTGKSPCDEVFSAFYDLTKPGNRFHRQPWTGFDDIARSMGKTRNSSIFGWAADEVMRRQLKELPLAQRVSQWPSHTQVKETMSRVKGPRKEVDVGGTNFGQIDVPPWVVKDRIDLQSVASFSLESHHGVPKKLQAWLGLTKDKDSSPAYLTTMLEHRGAEVGIHQRLSQKLGAKINTGPVPLNQGRPPGLTNQQIRDALRETYEEAGLGHFWEVCEVWLNTP